MPRLPRTPPRKEKVRGGLPTRNGENQEASEETLRRPWYRSWRPALLCSLALPVVLAYLLFRLCQTPERWPLFPLAEVGPWPLEQKLYNSLSTDRASVLEVTPIDLNRHLARHLLAHPAIANRSPSLEAIHISGHPDRPEIAARFRWKILPLHLRASALRAPAENRSAQDHGFAISTISVGTLPMPSALKDTLINWFNPLMATLKREKYLLKRSVVITVRQDSIAFHVSANTASTKQGVPDQAASPKQTAPSTAQKRSPQTAQAPASPPNIPSERTSTSPIPKALPMVPKDPRKTERAP